MRSADFRSDTVTVPTPEMRAAMAAAEVGDDVLDGDPTVRALEERTAELLGKEGALFVPSGTMANQVALGSWTRPGDELIVERTAHVVSYEAGAAGFLHGLQTRTIAAERGALDPDEVRALIRPDFIHCPRTALVCLEQTHMSSGGAVVPLAATRAVAAVAHEHDVRVHVDGARLFHAVVASGRPAAELVAAADSVSVCFSKGLGAPVGSAVAGPADFVERARLVRKRLGGWMRQAGIIAAGARWALDHGIERLADDHALARELAAVLERHAGIRCEPVETNIVIAVLADGGGPELVGRLEAEGVRALTLAPDRLRFITHRDVGPADVERLGRALARLP